MSPCLILWGRMGVISPKSSSMLTCSIHVVYPNLSHPMRCFHPSLVAVLLSMGATATAVVWNIFGSCVVRSQMSWDSKKCQYVGGGATCTLANVSRLVDILRGWAAPLLRKFLSS